MSTLTADILRQLRKCLPDLLFDPDQDRRACECPGFDEYLGFYNIDFASELPGTFHAMGRLVAGNYKIACHYWLPAGEARGTVVAVHGYFDHVGLFGHLIRYLLQHNYAVVAYDLPGHGLSSGERASIDSFDHYVDVFNVIQRRLIHSPLPSPLSAIGQSTGGAILIKRLLEQGGDDLERVALLAPLVAPAKWWLNRIVYALTHRFRTAVPRFFLTNSSDASFVEFLANSDPMQSRYIPVPWIGAMKEWVAQCSKGPPCDYPVTILQGNKDTTLAWRFNLRVLKRRFPQAQVVLLPDVRHHMVNEAEPLRNRIFAAMGFAGKEDEHTKHRP
ncbi:MAG: alpha/beta hydrolase [Porticoccaceae bacterium]|nr:alpha/beta hydrolase [Porticoccaceae bacterium]